MLTCSFCLRSVNFQLVGVYGSIICKSIVPWADFSYTIGMQKQYSKIIGTPVFLESGGRPLCRVVDLIIDPENGKIVAFSVAPGNKKLVAPMDVRSWTNQILIRSHDDIVDAEDLLRANEVLRLNTPIIKNKVVSHKDGESLGRVYDYAVHTELLVLKKIYVAKSILGLARMNDRIIPFKAIYEIMPKKIIVDIEGQVFEEDEEAKKALELGRA